MFRLARTFSIVTQNCYKNPDNLIMLPSKSLKWIWNVVWRLVISFYFLIYQKAKYNSNNKVKYDSFPITFPFQINHNSNWSEEHQINHVGIT